MNGVVGFSGISTGAGSAGEGGTTSKDGATSIGGFGKVYTPVNVAQLVGFCGITRAQEIPNIWTVFQCTKEYDTYHHELETSMTAWGRHSTHHSIEINKDIYFDNAPLESIAKLQFNPSGTGAGLAMWETADKGLSSLIYRPKTLAGADGNN